MLKNLRFVQESQTGCYESLKLQFPDIADLILELVDSDGNVNCSFTLKDGQTHSYGYVNFATLPFGIYTTVGEDRSPKLIPLEAFRTIEVIND